MTIIRHPDDVIAGHVSGPTHITKLALGPVKAAVTCNWMTASGMLIAALPSPSALNTVGVGVGVVVELLQAEVATTAAKTVSHLRVMSIHHSHAVSGRHDNSTVVLRTF